MSQALSVIIPNFNNSVYLEQCINSVLDQTQAPEEIIVVDDCSTDYSWKLLQRLVSEIPSLKIFRLNKNYGVSHARNYGAYMSRTEYITFLDADDYYYNNKKLEQELFIIAQSKKNIAYSPIVCVDDFGSVVFDQLDSGKYLLPCGRIYEELIAQYKIARPPRDYIMRRSAFFEAGGYDEHLSVYEDYDLLIRLAEQNVFKCTYVSGTAYRIKPGGLSDIPQDHLNYTRQMICEKYYLGLSCVSKLKVCFLRSIQRLYHILKKINNCLIRGRA